MDDELHEALDRIVTEFAADYVEDLHDLWKKHAPGEEGERDTLEYAREGARLIREVSRRLGFDEPLVCSLVLGE